MTVIKPHLPSGYTIFCDDLRQEVSGKVTIVGAYSGGMQIVAEGPISLPRFAAMVLLWTDPAAPRKGLVLKLMFETDDGEIEEVFSADFSAEQLGTATLDPQGSTDHIELRSMVQLANVQISRSGRFKVRFYDQSDEIRVGTLRVLISPPEGSRPENTEPKRSRGKRAKVG